MGKTTPWVIATGFAALVIAAVAWLFGIQPRLEAAEEARLQAENEQSRIDTLQIQLASLRADFARLDEFEEELDALRVQVPTEQGVSNLIRQLQAYATSSGVIITNALSETPTTVAVTREEAVQPPPPAEGDEPADGETPAEPTVQEVVSESEFYVIPLKIRTIGGYAETVEFLRLLQVASPRLILVTDLVMTSLEEASAEGGLPATFDGWVDVEHTFYVLVLPDPGAELPEPGPVPVPELDADSPFIRLLHSGDIITGGPGVTVPPTDDEGTGEADDTEADGGGEEGEDEG